jgi:hypothetical protein
MRPLVPILLSAGLLLGMATAQTTNHTANGAPPRPSAAVSGRSDEADPGKSPADDMQQLNADVQRLKVLVNQMRTNLAFVETTQSPLKHQFALEVDAWQVVLEQMERRVKQMEQKGNSKPKGQ